MNVQNTRVHPLYNPLRQSHSNQLSLYFQGLQSLLHHESQPTRGFVELTNGRQQRTHDNIRTDTARNLHDSCSSFHKHGRGADVKPCSSEDATRYLSVFIKKLAPKCNLRILILSLPGVPSQPSNFRATDIGETAVTLQWSRPSHSGENIVHYELYWNDTYANEQHHQ